MSFPDGDHRDFQWKSDHPLLTRRGNPDKNGRKAFEYRSLSPVLTVLGPCFRKSRFFLRGNPWLSLFGAVLGKDSTSSQGETL